MTRPLRVVPAEVSTEPLKTAEETAAFLGVAVGTLYGWRKHGRGPRGYRVGGRINFRLSEVSAWLEENREPIR